MTARRDAGFLFVVYLMFTVQGVGYRCCGLLSFFPHVGLCRVSSLLLLFSWAYRSFCGACGVIFFPIHDGWWWDLVVCFNAHYGISGIVILRVSGYCILIGVGTLYTHYVYFNIIIITSFFGIVLIPFITCDSVDPDFN